MNTPDKELKKSHSVNTIEQTPASSGERSPSLPEVFPFTDDVREYINSNPTNVLGISKAVYRNTGTYPSKEEVTLAMSIVSKESRDLDNARVQKEDDTNIRGIALDSAYRMIKMVEKRYESTGDPESFKQYNELLKRIADITKQTSAAAAVQINNNTNGSSDALNYLLRNLD